MKSDIFTIAMGELTATFDGEVMKAVRQVDIDVNKEELLKALELHRNLVRCGDCTWYDGKGHCYSDYISGFLKDVGSDDFCSYGERKDND